MIDAKKLAVYSTFHGLIYGLRTLVFYGILGIMFTYLLLSKGLDAVDARDFKSDAMLFLFIVMPVGGLLGDILNRPKLLAVIGGGLMAAACLWLALTGDFALVGPFGLLVIGLGLFNPNHFTLLGRLYTHRPMLMAGGFMMIYACFKMGIGFQHHLFPALKSIDYALAFGFGGVLMFVSTVLLWLFVPSHPASEEMPRAATGSRIAALLAYMLLTVPYWISIDLNHKFNAFVGAELLGVGHSTLTGLFQYLIIVVSILLSVYFYFRRFPLLLMMALAFFLTVLAMLPLYFFESSLFTIICNALLMGGSDLLVFAFGCTLMVKALPARWLGAASGLSFTLGGSSYLFYSKAIEISDANYHSLLLACMAIGLVGTLIYLLLYLFSPRTVGGRVGEG